MKEIILRALRSAGLPSTREPNGVLRTDGKRPDGMTLIPWKNGRSLLFDYTCADTYAKSYITKSSESAGAVAKMAEERKLIKYAELIPNYFFVPVAMETTGVWGKDGLRFIKEVGRRISMETSEPRATSYLLQRMSISLQKYNAACILGTHPKAQNLNEEISFSGLKQKY